MTTIRFTAGSDGIALLEMDLPGRPQNLLTPEFFDDLDSAVTRLREDDALIGAVLTGGKPSGFMAGADLKQVLDWQDAGVTPVDAAGWVIGNSAVFRRMETCGKPVVAAINGHALGGGLELALACHRRIVLNRSEIQLGLPEVTLGLLPGAGGTQRLPRMIGIEKALPLMLDGTRMSPAQALASGIIDELAADESALLAAARIWLLSRPAGVQPWDVKGFKVPGGAGPLAPHAGQSFQATSARLRATRGRYPAPHAVLSAVYEGTQLAFEVGLRVEAKYFGGLMAGAVSANLVRSFLRQVDARKPDGAAALTVRRMAVLGAGMMGAGIANVAAAAGIDVVLADRSREAAEQGVEQVRRHRVREVERATITPIRAAEIVARVSAAHEIAATGEVDMIVEAVFEDRAVKAAVYAQVLPMLAADGVLASNTSTLSITSLAATLPDPSRFIGLHFFSPVERMQLVEVIAGNDTSERTIADAFALVGRLRKTPILVHDSPGFYTSRVFCAYIDEAMAMLTEGVSPALIENAARLAGFPAPPLAVTDEVSLDLQRHVIDQAKRDGLDARFLRAHAEPVVEQMNALGRLGRKSGAGFYDYGEDGKRLWAGLAEIFPAAVVQPTAEDVGKRLLYIQSLESARCLAEGVIDDEATADLGSVLGIGYPAWTGGALSLISTMGADPFVEDCRRFAKTVGTRFDPGDAAIAAAAVAAGAARSGRLAA